MFRSATTRIAHNSTIPSLSTLNKDLKALQELINAEKSVMQTLQRLSADIAKAAECLKQWGYGEGDDLGDTLTASTALLLHYASSLSRFSNHEANVREQMKAIRKREETLDEVKRRRKALVSKADTADKKLSKMSAENKNFQAQADSLNKLREEIRTLDSEVLHEEASLGDFKRSTTKHWMGTKFGALMECSGKGVIVAEMGKLVIEEIPLTPTEPGLPRPYYQGHARTEFVIAEAQRALDEVTFSTEPGQRPLSLRPLSGAELPPIPAPHALAPGGAYTPTASNLSLAEAPSDMFKDIQSQVYITPNQQFNALPPIRAGTDDSFGIQSYMANDNKPPSQPNSPPPASSYAMQSYASSSMAPAAEVNEFGAYPAPSQFSPRSTSLRSTPGGAMESGQPISPVGGPRGPRFATFPTKITSPPSSRLQAGGPPSAYGATQGLGDRGPSLDLEQRESVSLSSSIAQALGQEWVEPVQEAPPPLFNSKRKMTADGSEERWTLPPPRYSVTPESPSMSSARLGDGTHTDLNDDDSAQLAYAASDTEDRTSRSSVQHGAAVDRHVRFGAVSEDDGVDLHSPGAPASQERIASQHHNEAGSAPQPTELPPHGTSPPRSPHDQPQVPEIPSSPTAGHVTATQHPISSYAEPDNNASQSATTEDEEKALNAAAAREISREMDALMFTAVAPSRPPMSRAPPPPDSPHVSLPARGGLSEDPAGSSPVSPRESSYMRQRDRASSIPASGASMSDYDHPLPPPKPQSPAGDVQSTPSAVSPFMPPPPTIALRGASPAHSFMSTDSAYRTPSEFPLAPPPAFYNHPSASGSGSFSPGGARTISAAAFKRQIRNPTSPVADANQPSTDVSPLVINKRGLPGSPRPPPRLGYDDGSGTQRVSSAPGPLNPGPDGYVDSRYRSVSGSTRPQSVAPSGDQGDEDEYDYISAYVDDNSGSSPETHRGLSPAVGGYGQGRYATHLEQEDIR
ncbi:Eisosome component PIL1-domain-containing protein [Cytidiella melzeri]|nr:Eisosome component PIL1-domain-containing protein [Cytidiella melzeri]